MHVCQLGCILLTHSSLSLITCKWTRIYISCKLKVTAKSCVPKVLYTSPSLRKKFSYSESPFEFKTHFSSVKCQMEKEKHSMEEELWRALLGALEAMVTPNRNTKRLVNGETNWTHLTMNYNFSQISHY